MSQQRKFKSFEFIIGEKFPVQSLDELKGFRETCDYSAELESVIFEDKKLTFNFGVQDQIVVILTTDELNNAFIDSITHEFSIDSSKHLKLKYFQLLRFY